MKFLIASVLFVLAARSILASSNAIDWSKVEPESADELFDLVNDKKPEESSNFVHKIIGGSNVKPHSFPFQAGLIINFDSYTKFAPGSLISPRSVLTCARRLIGSKSTLVILGANQIGSDEKKQQKQIVQASGYIIHPDFHIESWQANNLAILTLPDPVKYNKNIQPIELVEDIKSFASDSFVGVEATISGWDRNKIGRKTRNLQSDSVKIISNDACRQVWHRDVFDGLLCFQTEGTRNSCYENYAGPLTVNKNGTTVLVGVTTFVAKDSCKNESLIFPVGCARVSYFLNWIHENTDE